MHDKEKPGGAGRANRNPTLFACWGGSVQHRQGKGIGEHPHRLLKADLVFGQISRGLNRIPFEKGLPSHALHQEDVEAHRS